MSRRGWARARDVHGESDWRRLQRDTDRKAPRVVIPAPDTPYLFDCSSVLWTRSRFSSFISFHRHLSRRSRRESLCVQSFVEVVIPKIEVDQWNRPFHSGMKNTFNNSTHVKPFLIIKVAVTVTKRIELQDL